MYFLIFLKPWKAYERVRTLRGNRNCLYLEDIVPSRQRALVWVGLWGKEDGHQAECLVQDEGSNRQSSPNSIGTPKGYPLRMKRKWNYTHPLPTYGAAKEIITRF